MIYIDNQPDDINDKSEAKERTDSSPDTSKRRRYNIVGTNELRKYSVNDILADIAQRIGEGRRLIIPIGLPQSGKSMFIASLLAYAFKRDSRQDNSCNFIAPVDRRESGIETIINKLDRKETLPSTPEGFFSIIDLDMESNFRKGRRIRVSLIDFSGEDIERVVGKRDDIESREEKIMQLLRGCIAQRAIFAIITPVDEQMFEVGITSDFDRTEDNAMKGFIDKIRTNDPNLYRRTKFLMIVTKWDKITSNISPARFLRLHRNQLYNEYSGNSKSYGLLPFSVGNVTSKTIMDISLRSPKNFWYTLYRWSTGKHVLPWWKRIF